MATMRDLIFGGSVSSDHPGGIDFGLLVLRVGMGASLALAHGVGKVPPPSVFVEGVGALGFPFPEWFAWAAGLSEFVGGLLIVVGLLTRPAALLVTITMAVAVLVRHGGQAFAERELAVLYGVAAVALLLAGGGRFALDSVIRRRDRASRY